MFEISQENAQILKQGYLIAYNATGLIMSMQLLITLLPEATGMTDPLVSTYAKQDSSARLLYQASELLMLVEVLNHLVGLQKLKRHIFVFQMWALFVVFLVIPFYQAHEWVIYWVVIRSFRKLLRYLHRMYLDLGFRHEVFPLEWLCINGLCFSLPLEYLCGVIILLVTFPVARHASSLNLKICCGLSVDFSLLYFVALFLSIPYFLSSLVYICRKREQSMSAKYCAQTKRRQQKPRQVSSSSSDSD